MMAKDLNLFLVHQLWLNSVPCKWALRGDILYKENTNTEDKLHTII